MSYQSEVKEVLVVKGEAEGGASSRTGEDRMVAVAAREHGL